MSESSTSTLGFWDFTLASYGRDGVQASVIALQDEDGADVNMLFFCCWVGATGRGELQTAALKHADDALTQWRELVTVPLREIRERIKHTAELASLSGAPDVRSKVLSAEIDSERIAHGVLEGLAPADTNTQDDAPQLADGVESLRAYFGFLNVDLSAPVVAHLVCLLRGTFPDCPESQISELLAP